MKSKAIEQAAQYAGVKAASNRPVARDPAKPTAERRAMGVWVEPKGLAKHSNPMVDLACDMIGVLYQSKQINAGQEQAARLFQELRAGFLSELGTKGFGSCLADNQTGYDGGDGDPAALAAYRELESEIGRVKTACLILECDKGPGEKPINLDVLRRSLDAVSRC